MKNFLKYFLYYFIVVVCGIFIGTISWSFLYILNTLLHFLWLGHEGAKGILYSIPFIIPLFIIGGSMVLAFIYSRFTVIPKPGITYAKEYQEHKKVKYKDFIKIYLLAMAPIILGSSVGPEAALIGLLFMMSSFISDFTNYLEKKFNIILLKNEYEMFKDNIIHNKLYGLKIILLYLTSAYSLIHLLNLDKFPSFNVKLQPISLELSSSLGQKFICILLVGSILLAIGYLFGKFYNFSEHIIEKNFKRIKNIYLKMFLTSCILSVFALLFPVLILSGEGTLHMLSETEILYSAFALILLAFLKLIITHICISGNLKGGHIFPIIFASFLLGAGIGTLFNIDLTLAISSITVGTTLSIFSSWLAVFLLLALFFPFKFLAVLFIIALIIRERVAADQGADEL